MSGAASSVENTLASSVPVLIGFLASLAGVGGNLARQVKDLLARVKGRIDAVIDGLLERARRLLPPESGNVGRGQGQPRQAQGGAGRRQQQAPDQRPGAATNSAPQRRLNVEVRFRDAAGENHRMWMQRIGNRYRLMVASGNPEPVENSVKQGGKFADIDGQQENQVISKAHEAERLANQNSQENNPAVANQIQSKMNEIKPILETSGSELPPTHVTYQPNGNKAGWVLAEPLTKKPGNTRGSRPDPSIAGWSHVLTIDSINWEKGHLLSEKLHGPGRFWNIVPIIRTDNAWMRDNPEQNAKKRVADNKVLYYEVRVTYYSGAIVSDFPNNISVTWGSLKKQGNTYVRDGLSSLSRDLSPPRLTGSAIDLKTAGRELLLPLGIPYRLADNIAQERIRGGNFQGEADFRQRMQAYYAN